MCAPARIPRYPAREPRALLHRPYEDVTRELVGKRHGHLDLTRSRVESPARSIRAVDADAEIAVLVRLELGAEQSVESPTAAWKGWSHGTGKGQRPGRIVVSLGLWLCLSPSLLGAGGGVRSPVRLEPKFS
jgi:hypothetical protein